MRNKETSARAYTQQQFETIAAAVNRSHRLGLSCGCMSGGRGEARRERSRRHRFDVRRSLAAAKR